MITEAHEKQVLLPRGISAAQAEQPADNIIEWRPWSRDPRYIVGADGTIIGARGRVLKPGVYKGRALICTGRVNGRRQTAYVSTVVCETFQGPRPPGLEAAHENGNALDNRVGNLSWKTRLENEADKFRHGTNPAGERNPAAKLTDASVREIRRRRVAGETYRDIAADLHVGRHTVSLVCRGKVWSHVL